MSAALIVRDAGPGVTVQDAGRPGYLAFGLSRGGAADRLALAEGAALLGNDTAAAALEMAGMGGTFEAEGDLRIALTGAPMRAEIDGAAVAWNASHALPDGARLRIGAATRGAFGYLHLAGGVVTEARLGARAAHLTAGLGKPVAAGDRVPAGADPGGRTGLRLPVSDRFSGGEVRVISSLQTGFFPKDQRDRFESSRFERDPRSNRMGVRLRFDGDAFHVEGGLNVLSELIVPGDIQIAGDGTPFVLLAECQTTGGYPRIGTVIPADLPRIAQAPAGAAVGFRFVTREDALEAERKYRKYINGLTRALEPLIRDPATIRDLLSYSLVSGVTAGHDQTEGQDHDA